MTRRLRCDDDASVCWLLCLPTNSWPKNHDFLFCHWEPEKSKLSVSPMHNSEECHAGSYYYTTWIREGVGEKKKRQTLWLNGHCGRQAERDSNSNQFHCEASCTPWWGHENTRETLRGLSESFGSPAGGVRLPTLMAGLGNWKRSRTRTSHHIIMSPTRRLLV